MSFGVIAHTAVAESDDATLREAIAASDADNLAFVVVNGIKASDEACSDQLFTRRKALFEQAKNGLILSVAASDWSACRAKNGQSLAFERLNRVRDLFFGSDFSFGATRLPITRQGRIPKFRAYAENLRWEFDGFEFATVNLPANNNDFLHAAGRNSEFEDRMIANRAWLRRLFSAASQRGATGIVLFVDGNPLSIVGPRPDGSGPSYRDGFAEIRQQIQQLARRFNGKILLVHGRDARNTEIADIITWQENIASLHLSSGWRKVTIDATTPNLFRVDPATPLAKANLP